MSENSSRRCLFEKPDHDKTNRELSATLKKIDEIKVKEFKKRWNFDPVTEKPLPDKNSNQYEWKMMEGTSRNAIPENEPRTPRKKMLNNKPTRNKPPPLVSTLIPVTVEKEKGESSTETFTAIESDSQTSEQEEDINQNITKKRKCIIKDNQAEGPKKCKSAES